MPLYQCCQCGCVENTAAGRYIEQLLNAKKRDFPFPAKCSECYTGQWHGTFEKRPALGLYADADGFLYAKREDAPVVMGLVTKDGIEPLLRTWLLTEPTAGRAGRRHGRIGETG